MFSEDVKAPQNIDEPWYKNKGTLGMLGLSVAWAGATIHYLVSSGWWAMRYEMTPPEFFSFITGILFPVAFIWIAGSYLTGYARNEQEAKKLRRYMHAFLFTSSKNKIYSKTLIEGLKEQIAELNDVYAKIQDSAELVEKRLKEVEKLSQHMNDEPQNAVEKITESSEQVMMATNFLAENAAENGVKFCFNRKVDCVAKNASGGFTVTANGEKYDCDVVVNCAGVHSDDINNTLCEEKENIVARKGEYMLLDKSYGNLTYATLIQLPTAMGKGVLVSPTVHGNVIVGPTADDVPDKDNTDTTVDGLNKAFKLASLSVPSLTKRMIITQFSCMLAHSDKNDFTVGESETAGFYNALGIESPGLSSAPAIAVYLAGLIAEKY